MLWFPITLVLREGEGAERFLWRNGLERESAIFVASEDRRLGLELYF